MKSRCYAKYSGLLWESGVKWVYEAAIAGCVMDFSGFGSSRTVRVLLALVLPTGASPVKLNRSEVLSEMGVFRQLDFARPTPKGRKPTIYGVLVLHIALAVPLLQKGLFPENHDPVQNEK